VKRLSIGESAVELSVASFLDAFESLGGVEQGGYDAEGVFARAR
jgi:hypothetical protein